MKQTPFKTKSIVAILTVAFSSLLAQAHPGHNLTDATPAHLLASPDHLLTLALLGAGLLFSAALVKRVVARRAMQIGGAAALMVSAVTVAHQLLG